jgi:hypothetical protein
MSQKIVITKPTYNALTETDPRNIIFSSDYDNLKYYASGNTTVNGAYGVTTVEVSHNLGYIPFFVAYVGQLEIDSADEGDYCMIPYVFSTMGYFFHASVWADSSKFYFQIEHNIDDTTIPMTFYYKIFRNDLGL